MSESQNGDLKGIDDALNSGIPLQTLQGEDRDHLLEAVKLVAHRGQDSCVAAFVGNIEWSPEPLPLPEDQPLPDIELEMLPEEIRSYCHTYAENLQVSLSYIAVPLIASVGAIVGSAIRVSPKVFDDWLVCINFWFMLIGPPSVRKSPAEKAGSRGLQHVASHEEEKFRERLKGWKPTEEKLFAQKKGVLERISQIAAGKKKDKDSPEAAQAELERIENELAKRPKAHCVVTNDATVEKLAEMEAVNGNGIALKRDELPGWLEKLDGSDNRGDRAFYIEGFEGGNRYRVDRLSREAASIDSHTISIGGTAQPGPIRYLVSGASGLSKKNDGLIQRFSLTVVQIRPKSHKYVDKQVDPLEVENLKKASLHMRRWAEDILSNKETGFINARFSSEAQMDFVRIFEELQGKVCAAEEYSDFQAHLGKYPKLLPSLAMTFRLIRAAYRSEIDPPTEIELCDLLMAEKWASVLEVHARWLYGILEGSVSPEARALAEKIQDGNVRDGDNLRSIYRRGWSFLKNEEMLSAAIEELASYGWCVSDHERGSKGAPAIVIRIHPSFAGVKNGRQ